PRRNRSFCRCRGTSACPNFHRLHGDFVSRFLHILHQIRSRDDELLQIRHIFDADPASSLLLIVSV
ncbi:hypothetical protein PMAYCL1PPCAC_32746, partial [Pristionchus mayeri]